MHRKACSKHDRQRHGMVAQPGTFPAPHQASSTLTWHASYTFQSTFKPCPMETLITGTQNTVETMTEKSTYLMKLWILQKHMAG